MSETCHTPPRSAALRDYPRVCIWVAFAAIVLLTPAFAREGVPQPALAALSDIPDVDDVWGEPYVPSGAVGPARDFRVLIEVDHAARPRRGEQPAGPGR